uniref:Rhodanese domain-containing protein n=1 Tax=Bos mutus grunniens TaxID=30521 RepID=A0A8B9X0F5_BOSMU
SRAPFPGSQTPTESRRLREPNLQEGPLAVEYNSWHVLSSVNICCSKLVKRRLQQGKVTIAELIQPAARSQVCSPPDVVVYDQSTRDASVLAADSFLSILLSKLDGCFDSVAILTGAFRGLSPCWRQGGAGKPATLLPMSLSQPCLLCPAWACPHPASPLPGLSEGCPEQGVCAAGPEPLLGWSGVGGGVQGWGADRGCEG